MPLCVTNTSKAVLFQDESVKVIIYFAVLNRVKLKVFKTLEPLFKDLENTLVLEKIISSEAYSIISPLTVKSPSISCVLKVTSFSSIESNTTLPSPVDFKNKFADRPVDFKSPPSILT